MAIAPELTIEVDDSNDPIRGGVPLAGMILGQRLKVVVLFPTMALAFASALAAGTARGEDAFDSVLVGLAIMAPADRILRRRHSDQCS
jgi:hypothetical protein